MKEKRLAAKILQGDKKAINLFYKTFKPKITSFLKAKISSKKDREEVMQDIFLTCFNCLPTFKFKSSLSTWVFSITRHEVSDYYRKKKLKTVLFSRLPFLEKLADKALGPELALQEKEAKQKIKKTFKNINEGYAQILRLKYIEGLSMAQIAGKLDKTVKAVESKLSRARLAFQKEYGKYHQTSNQKAWQILASFNYKGELSS
jgi:RNA polymerase sigma-70 factor, ECF subfamily